jgi:hypothetical protein
MIYTNRAWLEVPDSTVLNGENDRYVGSQNLQQISELIFPLALHSVLVHLKWQMQRHLTSGITWCFDLYFPNLVVKLVQ